MVVLGSRDRASFSTHCEASEKSPIDHNHCADSFSGLWRFNGATHLQSESFVALAGGNGLWRRFHNGLCHLLRRIKGPRPRRCLPLCLQHSDAHTDTSLSQHVCVQRGQKSQFKHGKCYANRTSNNDCLSRYPEETMLLSSRTWPNMQCTERLPTSYVLQSSPLRQLCMSTCVRAVCLRNRCSSCFVEVWSGGDHLSLSRHGSVCNETCALKIRQCHDEPSRASSGGCSFWSGVVLLAPPKRDSKIPGHPQSTSYDSYSSATASNVHFNVGPFAEFPSVRSSFAAVWVLNVTASL